MSDPRANVSTGLTPEQRAFRLGGIGASEIAALAGFSKWATPIEIYQSKIGLVADEVSSYQARIGILGEQVFADAWAAAAGRVVVPVHTMRHPLNPYAIATPDFAVFAPGVTPPPLVDAMGRRALESVAGCERLLQVKSSSWRMRGDWGAPGTDQVPVEYLCQAHWEGAIAGVDEVLIVVDFDKTQLLEYPIKVSLDTFAELYAIAERFMVEHVEARVPPLVDGSTAWADFLARSHPKTAKRDAKPEHLVLGDADEVSVALYDLAHIAAAEKRLKTVKTYAENVVKRAIGDGSGLSGDWGEVTWLENAPTTKVDWKSFAYDLANIVSLLLQGGPVSDEERADLAATAKGLEAKHTKSTPGARVLRKTWKKGGALDFSGRPVELSLERPASILDDAAPTNEGTEE